MESSVTTSIYSFGTMLALKCGKNCLYKDKKGRQTYKLVSRHAPKFCKCKGSPNMPCFIQILNRENCHFKNYVNLFSKSPSLILAC